jgi:hypothetical protein
MDIAENHADILDGNSDLTGRSGRMKVCSNNAHDIPLSCFVERPKLPRNFILPTRRKATARLLH